MKRLTTPKRQFTFTVGDNPAVLGVGDLDDHPQVKPIYEKWLNSQKAYERDWRNHELSETDWMLVADATFGGEPLAGSDKLDEIIEYRRTLREYNLTTDDRPAKPAWLT